MAGDNSKQIIAFLEQVPFFSEVTKSSLKTLYIDSETQTFAEGDMIIEHGDEGSSMFVILSGRVKVHQGGHIYGYLSGSDCFGEYALLDNRERSASVTAVERTEVLKIEQRDFLGLMARDKGFAMGILAVMIKRHRELDEIQEQLASSKRELEIAGEKMSGLIEGAMDAILMFDRKFRLILTNPSANQLLENEDALSRNVLFFLDEESAEYLESLVQNAAGKSGTGIRQLLERTIRVIGSDGGETINEGTISSYGAGDDMFFTLILRDLSERIEADRTIGRLTERAETLEQEIEALTGSHGIIAEHQGMRNLMQQIEQVAATDATVLIRGETGTGKELVARALHEASERSDKPLIRINCGAIPANLIESELFGHEKGAFTGATSKRDGRFKLADKGTLFLDEIGELPLDLQPKLLRVIQEGEFDPVGSSQTVKVDVRIIAATHRDLLKAAKDGKFREDLYYRLNVFPLEVPPLRDRGSDVCLIAREMIKRYAAKLNKKPIQLSEADEALFEQYHWPGNVRELQNLVERAMIIATKPSFDWRSVLPSGQPENGTRRSPDQPEPIYSVKEMQEMERANIIRALKKTSWRVSGKNGAAALLDMPATTLASKMNALGISRPV